MYLLKRKLMLTENQETLVRNKILALSRQERMVIHLYFWEEYSHTQIARNICVSVHDIPKLIQNAMSKIRAELFGVADIYFETYRASNTYKNWGV